MERNVKSVLYLAIAAIAGGLVGYMIALNTTAGSVIGVNTPNPSSDINTSLYQEWTHSREEDSDPGIEIYRPSGSRTFPASWFRMSYAFQKDGVCSWLVLDSLDAHYMADGRCEYSQNGKETIMIYDDAGKEVEELTIVELSDSILKLKK